MELSSTFFAFFKSIEQDNAGIIPYCVVTAKNVISAARQSPITVLFPYWM